MNLSMPRQTDRQTDRQAGRQAGRQATESPQKKAERQTDDGRTGRQYVRTHYLRQNADFGQHPIRAIQISTETKFLQRMSCGKAQQRRKREQLTIFPTYPGSHRPLCASAKTWAWAFALVYVVTRVGCNTTTQEIYLGVRLRVYLYYYSILA